MVRKSVMIGFGLWVLAVVSVAAIAWLAIDTAARPITALSVAAGPSPNEASPASPVFSSPAPDPTTPVTASAKPSSRPPATRAATQDAATPAFFGTVTTEGGRVRAQCRNQKATLDGGYARPEPGWMVRVNTQYDRVTVFFGSSVRMIGVMAQCSGGRPDFTQYSRSRRDGSPFPEQSQSAPAVSPPPTSPAIPPQPLLKPATTATAEPNALANREDARAGQAPDDVKVAAYVTAQDQMCAPDPGWSSRWGSGWSRTSGAPEGSASPWCARWNAMSVVQRYELVWLWLYSDQAAQAARADQPAQADQAARDQAAQSGAAGVPEEASTASPLPASPAEPQP